MRRRSARPGGKDQEACWEVGATTAARLIPWPGPGWEMALLDPYDIAPDRDRDRGGYFRRLWEIGL
ncbi:hypothetical protein FAGKG844_400005 [Frankia sp. AgKG'84/4]